MTIQRFLRLSIPGGVLAWPLGALANPILLEPVAYGATQRELLPRLLVLMFPATILIEVLFLRLTGPKDAPAPSTGRVVIVNLLTYPVTQFLGLYISMLAELVPLLVEPVALSWNTPRKTGMVWRVICANLLSFAAGFILLLFL